MKKKLILFMFLFIPFIRVNALECYNKDIDVTSIGNFPCSEIKGDKLTFTYNNSDYKDYFNYEIQENDGNKTATITPNKSLKFDSDFEKGYVIVSDGTSSATLTIKNQAYIPPTTTKETTTTKDSNIKEVFITLDPNNGSEPTKESCKIATGSSYCNITLPKLDTEGFNGWGTASTCKEGSIGQVKIEKDITYYACNAKNTSSSSDKTILLKSLKIKDKDTNEEIKFGTFSIKKTEYSFKVLYDVENLSIDATSEDGISIEITGNENLVVGENNIVIKLTTSDNKTNEYKLKVTRLKKGEKIDNKHYLKSLVIGGYNINFNKSTFDYKLTISSDINKLEITPISEESDIKPIVLNNENLKDGSVIKINLTGDDDITTTYSIIITKEKSNLILYIGLGVLGLLIIILIVLIIIKSNRKKKNNLNTKPNDNSNIEVLNI